MSYCNINSKFDNRNAYGIIMETAEITWRSWI